MCAINKKLIDRLADFFFVTAPFLFVSTARVADIRIVSLMVSDYRNVWTLQFTHAVITVDPQEH